MGAPAWERSREKQLSYARRQPETTEFYRLIYHHRDELSWKWEELFQDKYGVLRKEVLDAFDKYLSCGILENGCARARCPTCSYSRLVGFSCKRRGVCPSCAAKRAVLFAEHLHHNVLEPVPQRHMVASVPKRIRCFFRYNRSRHQILFDAAWQTIREFYENAAPQVRAAAVLALQTAGDALNHNPHLHGIVPDGVFLADGSFQQLPKPSTEKLTAVFAHKVLSALKEQGLIGEKTIAQILSQKNTGFSLWLGDPIEPDDEAARLFLGRYIERGPVANERIEIMDDIVTYHHENEHLPTAEFSALEFLAALSVQVPKKWEQLVHYYGHYSSRARGARKKLAAAQAHDSEQCNILPPPEGEHKRALSKGWAALIKRVYEADPLVCPESITYCPFSGTI